MTLKSALDTDAVRTPWPLAVDGILVADGDIGSCRICTQKCNYMDCLEPKETNGPHTCSLGLTFFQYDIDGHHCTIYGVVIGDRSHLTGSPWLKSAVKGRYALPAHVSKWVASLRKLAFVFEEHDTSAQNDLLNGLHDTYRWAREMFHAAEKIVWKDRSRPFRDSFYEATTDEKTIYKSARILLDTFDFVTIYSNPDAARYDDKKPIELYKLFDKIRIILNYTKKGGPKENIEIEGSSFSSYRLYETFKLIPFALLDNAQKYCLERGITVRVDENCHGVRISVESIGPHIQDNEKTRVFEKGFRGEHARTLKDRGTGIGLYVAQVVAHAHDSQIHVESTCLGRTKEGVPLANNRFWLKVTNQDKWDRPSGLQ